MKIKNIHSVVDLITNSSTVIYTQAREGSINTIKEIINTILDIGGSSLTADDLFTFRIDPKIHFEYDYELVEILDDHSNQNIFDQYERICNPKFVTNIDCCGKTLTESCCSSCGSNRDNLLYRKNKHTRRDYSEIEKEFKAYLESIGFDEEKITSILIDSDYRDGNYDSFLVITPKEGIDAPDNLGKQLASLFESFESNDY